MGMEDGRGRKGGGGRARMKIIEHREERLRVWECRRVGSGCICPLGVIVIETCMNRKKFSMLWRQQSQETQERVCRVEVRGMNE